MDTCNVTLGLADKKPQVAGFTWVSVLAVLAILGGLCVSGSAHWQTISYLHAKRVLREDISRAIVFSKALASAEETALTLRPLLSGTDVNWASGMVLSFAHRPLDVIYTWSWRWPSIMTLTWHGFQGENQLGVSASADSLAMNGYFLLEARGRVAERWVVNRFGQIRVLRKHVA